MRVLRLQFFPRSGLVMAARYAAEFVGEHRLNSGLRLCGSFGDETLLILQIEVFLNFLLHFPFCFLFFLPSFCFLQIRINAPNSGWKLCRNFVDERQLVLAEI